MRRRRRSRRGRKYRSYRISRGGIRLLDVSILKKEIPVDVAQRVC